MSLLDKLSGVDPNGIKHSVHHFWASMAELAQGKITEAQHKAAFGIVSGDDLTEWNWLKGQFDGATNKHHFVEYMHVLFILAEDQMYGYHVKATMQARIVDLASESPP